MNMSSLVGNVGLFFLVNGNLKLYTCTLVQAQHYGCFLNYPYSHDFIWLKHYQHIYHVDFDYWPRGRIIYNTEKQVYLLYYDRCMEKTAIEIAQKFGNEQVQLILDEHYQCHMCNAEYNI